MKTLFRWIPRIAGLLALCGAIYAAFYFAASHRARLERLESDAERSEQRLRDAESTSLAVLEGAKQRAIDDIKKLQVSVQSSELPVGTIIASLLKPEKFQTLYGDKWILADGRNIIGTPLSEAIQKESIPDLGGRFLRAINTKSDLKTQDSDGTREPGAFQPDAFARHDHEGKRVPWGWLSWRANGKDEFWDRNGGKYQDYRTSLEGGDETRPRNIAAYFYIKIK
jgi:hypothetical protein